MIKPIYEMAVMNVKLRYPDAQDARVSSGDARFRTTLKEALWAEYAEENFPEPDAAITEFEELWTSMLKPRFIPDLWWIDSEAQIVHLFEIEDTHPLTQEKLGRLHGYWWDLDSVSWKLTLTVFDRYGLNARILDLSSFAFHIIEKLNQNRERV